MRFGRDCGVGLKLGLAALTILVAAVGAEAEEAAHQSAYEAIYESASTFEASAILAPDLVRGKFHQVVEAVANDGYMNSFVINSDFGQFEAYSELMLAIRIHEIGALAELTELSKTKVFVDAVATATMGQVESIVQFAEKPVQTVKGLPGGVKRMFKRAKWDAEEGVEVVKELGDKGSDGGSSEDEKSTTKKTKEMAKEGAEATEKYAKKYLGVSNAERRWAEKLGVDPYTSNEILMRKIKKVAKVDAAGSFGVRLAPIPRIPGVRYVEDVNKLVWSTDPRELRELNMKSLAEMGAEEDSITSLLDSPWYSPSTQTHLVALLSDLDAVEDRIVAIDQAAKVGSRDEARFFVQALTMVAEFHRHQAPLSRLVGGARLPVGLTGEGRLVFLVPVDDVFWTDGIAEAVEGRYAKAPSGVQVTSREVWFRGGVSARCRQELEERGWLVFAEIDLTG